MLKRLLVLVLASALLLGAACGDDSDGNGSGSTPEATAGADATMTPPPVQTAGTVSVAPASASVGEALTVTVSNWRGEGPVAIYLLTEEQSGDNQTAARAIANQEAVKLGETDADDDGNASFEFTLDAEFEIEGGGTLAVESDAELTVFALQGSSGSRAEPITVQ